MNFISYLLLIFLIFLVPFTFVLGFKLADMFYDFLSEVFGK